MPQDSMGSYLKQQYWVKHERPRCAVRRPRVSEQRPPRLGVLLDPIADPERLAAAGDWLVRCHTGEEFLARATPTTASGSASS